MMAGLTSNTGIGQRHDLSACLAKRLATLAFALMLVVCGLLASAVQQATSAFAATVSTTEGVGIPFTVEKHLSGDTPTTQATFTFDIAAKTQDAPMPANTSIAITGEGTASFGEIAFDTEGTYVYTITERDDGQEGYTYDDTAYDITVIVERDANGDLKTQVTASREGSTEKPAAISFTNAYKATGASSAASTTSTTTSTTSTASTTSVAKTTTSGNTSGTSTSASKTSGSTAKTGDSSAALLCVAACATAGAALVVISVARRRRDSQED